MCVSVCIGILWDNADRIIAVFYMEIILTIIMESISPLEHDWNMHNTFGPPNTLTSQCSCLYKDPLPGRTGQPSCTGLNNPVSGLGHGWWLRRAAE